MISMLSMQMKQQTQQFSMHQQMFQQQMQIQMAAMEKRAETSEKYLCWIAKTIGCNKRTSEEQNFDLAKLIFIRVRYVHADPINFIC